MLKKLLVTVLCLCSAAVLASPRAETAWSFVEQGAVLIDVRTPAEFSQGHLHDARNIPLQVIGDYSFNLELDKSIVVYCRSGNRSSQALAILQARGFTQVHNGGGLAEMQAASNP